MQDFFLDTSLEEPSQRAPARRSPNAINLEDPMRPYEPLMPISLEKVKKEPVIDVPSHGILTDLSHPFPLRIKEEVVDVYDDGSAFDSSSFNVNNASSFKASPKNFFPTEVHDIGGVFTPMLSPAPGESSQRCAPLILQVLTNTN